MTKGKSNLIKKVNNGIPSPDWLIKITWTKGKFKRLLKKIFKK